MTMNADDISYIEDALELRLPQSYVEAVCPYPLKLAGGFFNAHLSHNPQEVLRNNLFWIDSGKACHRVPEHCFVIGAFADEACFYIDLRQEDSPVTSVKRLGKDIEVKEAAPNIRAFVADLLEEQVKDKRAQRVYFGYFFVPYLLLALGAHLLFMINPPWLSSIDEANGTITIWRPMMFHAAWIHQLVVIAIFSVCGRWSCEAALGGCFLLGLSFLFTAATLADGSERIILQKDKLVSVQAFSEHTLELQGIEEIVVQPHYGSWQVHYTNGRTTEFPRRDLVRTHEDQLLLWINQRADAAASVELTPGVAEQFAHQADQIKSMVRWTLITLAALFILACLLLRLNLDFGERVFRRLPREEIRTNKAHIVKYTVIPIVAAIGLLIACLQML